MSVNRPDFVPHLGRILWGTMQHYSRPFHSESSYSHISELNSTGLLLVGRRDSFFGRSAFTPIVLVLRDFTVAQELIYSINADQIVTTISAQDGKTILGFRWNGYSSHIRSDLFRAGRLVRSRIWAREIWFHANKVFSFS